MRLDDTRTGGTEGEERGERMTERIMDLRDRVWCSGLVSAFEACQFESPCSGGSGPECETARGKSSLV